MSSFKADNYYEAHADDMDPDYRESSDEDSEESEIPLNMQRERAQWVLANHDALTELFTSFMIKGNCLFGDAFFQLGRIDNFCKFLFKYTTPGCVN